MASAPRRPSKIPSYLLAENAQPDTDPHPHTDWVHGRGDLLVMAACELCKNNVEIGSLWNLTNWGLAWGAWVEGDYPFTKRQPDGTRGTGGMVEMWLPDLVPPGMVSGPFALAWCRTHQRFRIPIDELLPHRNRTKPMWLNVGEQYRMSDSA
jgi:hypothetical protein